MEVLDFSFALREQLFPFIASVAIRDELGFERFEARLHPQAGRYPIAKPHDFRLVRTNPR
ncbi:hypothetical protein [Paraburkholderia aromaticivorans]|uniref:hypothetical protein n=1 Tax=Paraburkholderia aromaticivorans TaxID=2026199 RepID=UPI00145602FF|nr:hypothetical protein [Paraburkholderia aromaticivorans]